MLLRHRAIRTNALASDPPAFVHRGTVIDPRNLNDDTDDHYVPEPPRHGGDDYVRSPGRRLGDGRSGSERGRDAPDKTPFVATVETADEGHPLRMKLTVVAGLGLPERNCRPGATALERRPASG